MSFVVVFLSMLAMDFVFAQYAKRAGDRRPTSAANWAAMIIPLNYFVVTGYVDSFWMVLPAMAGAWLGTHIAVSRDDG